MSAGGSFGRGPWTPLLFPNKNQAGNKHIAFEMVKLDAPSKDTALGLGSLPACVRERLIVLGVYVCV